MINFFEYNFNIDSKPFPKLSPSIFIQSPYCYNRNKNKCILAVRSSPTVTQYFNDPPTDSIQYRDSLALKHKRYSKKEITFNFFIQIFHFFKRKFYLKPVMKMRQTSCYYMH